MILITAPDFSKKQIAVVFCNDGEKMALSNSNFIVKTPEGKIKFQCTCYRLFLVFVVGHCSITTPLIQAAKKFGFFIALMTPGFRLYNVIGAEKEGNTLLHRKQYAYSEYDIGKHIIKNKIECQISELKSVRNKNDYVKEAISTITSYLDKIDNKSTINEIMAYEGLSSKLYFRNHFNNIEWNGRQPRLKRDYVNSTLDIGYTLLFAFIDAILSSYGFDTYCGVLHREFYMRKSLVCDIVEPFRTIVDHDIKCAINLKQIQKNDFILINHQYKLKYTESAKYVKLLMTPIIDQKDEIFLYIQNYYRAFMKDLSADKFPVYRKNDI